MTSVVEPVETRQPVVEPVETRRPATWHIGTVVDVAPETSSARRLTIEVPDWPGNDAGSHLDIRLTAPDGYQAQRSYSIASAGEGTKVVLAVDELPDGEVSPFLVRDVAVGDKVELHGPLGAFFVWRAPDPGDTAPALVQLIAGGSGIVPLFAMLSAHQAAGDATEFRLLYSVRTPSDVFFRPELDAAMGVDYIYTRETPDGWPTPAGRITRDALRAAILPPDRNPRIYVCGPTPYVEAVANWLVDLGHPTASIRTERFGGS
ncbi:ferredoxin reductase [soil metagenome]